MLDRDQNRCTRIKKSVDISPFGAGSNPIVPAQWQRLKIQNPALCFQTGSEPSHVWGRAAPPFSVCSQLIRSCLQNCLLRIGLLGVLSGFQTFY